MDDIGRPEYTEDQYQKWFDELTPFFKLGETLNSAIEDAGLQKHRTTLYGKMRLNDWFSDKMKVLQEYPGKIANNILVKRLMQVDEKIKQGLPVTEEEMKDVRFIAEKHRSSQPYFVNKHELTQTASPDYEKIDDLLDKLEEENGGSVDDVVENMQRLQVEEELKNQTVISP